MKLFVLGATGFVGQAFCKIAAAHGHAVTAAGRFSKNIEEFHTNPNITCTITDYSLDSLRKQISRADAVICLAAVRPGADFTVDSYLENIKIIGNALEACRLEGIETLIFLSSISVYSGSGAWREDSLTTPLSLYGESKIAGENLCLYYNRNYHMKNVCLRCAQILGWGERKGYMLNTFLDNAAKGLPLVIYGEGKGRRQYLYIKDVAGAILHAAEQKIPGIFNIGISRNISVAELASCINQVFDNNGNLRKCPGLTEDTRTDQMDMSRTEKILKWQPAYSLTEALKDMKKEYQEEGYV